MKKPILLKLLETKTQNFEWGELSWFASGELGNSETMTVGRCIIKTGYENYKHSHSNCEEILYVLSGNIIHYVEDESIMMNKGDTITIPAGLVHFAKNISDTNAVLMISFSSADRQTEHY